MAKRRHHRRHYRGLGAMVQIPGLGFLGKSVSTTDVLVGAVIGMGGTLLLKGLGNKMFAGKLPDIVLQGSPLIGGALAGGAAYMLEKGKNKARANGHLAGALFAGAAIQAWDFAKTQWPEGLGDVVSLKLQGYRGLFVNEQTPRVGPGGAAMNGLLIDENPRSMSDANLAQLASYSMGDSESSGMEELMDLE